MKVVICQKFKSYKEDSVKYLVLEVLNRPFVVVVLIYVAITLIHFLNKASYLYFFPEIIGLLVFSLGVGISGMILYSIFSLLKTIKKVNNEKNTLYEGKVHIIMDNECVIIQKEDDENSLRRNWNQIKEFKVIGKTAYLIPVKKNDFMIRINQKEVIEGRFKNIINFIKSKML